ncbi:C2 domain-containing protein [Pseudomassariella vexata]|uniref:C2 domain-containing protein n=1 Tax=Pseudomassariella vexata TaxID=1141098 RepID=A0A1Y2E588_9PEZI|nr:C2 domain-containing protein [Pseudomassariella vexata]ORY66524.1 C2 domain-containing protein [Pseudomassariella vexata]
MATEQSAAELKQQGAIEAAGNPDSYVTADDAQKKMVEESKNAGVAAFSFDPDASPEEKKRQAKAAIPDELRHHRPIGVAIATDIDDGTKAEYALPSPSKAGALDIHTDKDGKPVADGTGPEGEEEDLASKVGWTQQYGWPSESVFAGESMLDHQTWLEGQVPDSYYGDWYHNSAIIIFACISSWLIAVLGGGLAWVFIIMAICSTYYRTSIRRVRRNFRDDVTRELALKKLDTDEESLEWINSFLVKFWPIYQPVLAQTIINSVDQVLSSATPAFLDSLKLKTFTLGSKPPRMEHVKTYPKVEDDTVVMDWKFSFTPNDTADMTARQVKNKINPKIVLEIRVGKAMISKGLDVIVADMAFSGTMRLKIKLQFPFPHIEKVEMSFLDRPAIDYVCKPLGGDTFGFDINFIPGLESFILEQIHGNLAPMMYAPNVFPIEVAKMLAGTPVDQAIGVVAVTLHGAQGLKNPDNFSGNPDPYAVFTLNKRAPLAQSKTVKDTGNPRWNETHYIIISSFNDSLDVMVYDYNEFRKDKELGVASFALEQLEELNVFENERLEVTANGKARGVITADFRFFPVLEETKLPDGTIEPPPESNTGILRYTVEQAKDLDGTKSLVGLLNPYACLLLNEKEIHTTKKLKRTNNPIWDNGSKEILITDRKKAKLGLAIKDDRELSGDQVIGTHQIKLNDMLEMMEQGKDWYNLSGVKTGRVKITAQWKPVTLSGVLASSGGYQTPIGVMRLHFKSAKGLRNLETMGKSDPYVRVVLSGIEKARTVTHRNTLDPEWDEVLYIPMHSSRDRLHLEVMDAEKLGKDRSLGLIELLASDYIQQEQDGEYLVHDMKENRQDGLRLHGKGVEKGILSYNVAFYPCLNIADPDDEEEEEEEEPTEAAKQRLDVPRSADAGKIPSLDRSLEKEPTTPVSPTMPRSPTSPAFSTPGRKSRDIPREAPKIRLSPEELLKHESGFLIFKLMESEMPKSDTHLEVYVDDMLYPSYVSGTAKNKVFKFDELGDCFIRELDFSRLTLKVREKREKPGEERDEDHTVARLAGNTLDTLKQCLNNPTVLKLKDEENRTATVKVSLKYIPVKMRLDPSESINNMGNLRVDILDAADLPAADSNGKSDPYAKFVFNGQDVFKTKTQKKTLHPVWNEFFEMAVPSRTAAEFHVNIYDYDFADKPDFLGGADINLEQLDPFQAKEVKLLLDGKSGSIRLRLLFRPDYVTRSRMGTSTFSGTFSVPGRIVTGVAGAPIKGGAAVVGGIGHGVGKGASFIKRGFKGGKKEDDQNGTPITPSAPDIPAIVTNGESPPLMPAPMLKRPTTGVGRDGAESPESPPGTANGNRHHRAPSMGGLSVHSLAPGSAGSGTATFLVVSASGFPPSADVYVTIRQLTPKERAVGKTKHHKSPQGLVRFDETFKHTCNADTQFRIEVKDHNTFGSDDDLGEALYFVDDTASGSEKEIKVGSGSVIMKSSFVETQAESPRAGIRRSFLSKRETRGSREVTPS